MNDQVAESTVIKANGFAGRWWVFRGLLVLEVSNDITGFKSAGE